MFKHIFDIYCLCFLSQLFFLQINLVTTKSNKIQTEKQNSLDGNIYFVRIHTESAFKFLAKQRIKDCMMMNTKWQ
jgi:hypothetical protein